LSSTGGVNLASLSFAGAGGASVGVSNGVVLISAPTGGGGAAGTVSAYQPLSAVNTTVQTIGNGTLAFVPLNPSNNVTFRNLLQSVSIATVSSATATPITAGYTNSFALYGVDTASSNRLTQITSGSFYMNMAQSSSNSYGFTMGQGASIYTITSTNASTQLSSLSGYKQIFMPFSGSMAAGNSYYLGVGVSYTSTVTNAMRVSQLSVTQNVSAGYGVMNTAGVTGSAGSVVNSNNGFFYTATSNAWPGTIFTNQVQTAANNAAPYVVFSY
jgi:hypothetical protein